MATKKTTAAEETAQKPEPKTTKKKTAPKAKPATDPKPEKKIEDQPEQIIEPEKAPEPKGKTYTVQVKTRLNVRSGAGKDNKIIRQLENGTKVTVTAEKNGWAEISPNNWVDKTFLK